MVASANTMSNFLCVRLFIVCSQIDQIQEQTSRDFEGYKLELQRVLPAFKSQLETFVAEHKVS
jgi:hypothetical protein